MSKYDKAGLVQIPSGYKAGTLYSVVPTSSNGDFDVTRASTATRVNKDGLIETVAANVPRLDYPLLDGVVQDCPALLLEPSRTNLITYSEDFSNAAWSKTNATITANNAVSPNGSQNAYKYTATNVTNSLLENITASNGSYSVSIFVKRIDTDVFRMNFSDNVTGEIRYSFNLLNESSTIVKSGGTISDYSANYEKLPNGWYRLNITATTNSGSQVLVYFEADNQLGSFYIYGAQLEAGSYPTSYIPTSGSAVTRIAETCNGAGTSAEFNDSEGVLFIEANGLGSTGNLQFGITNGSNDNEAVKILYYLDNTVRFEMKTLSGTNFVKDVDISHTRSEIFKGALQYKSNEYKVFANGFKYNVTQTSATPTGLSDLRFNTGNNASPFYGNTKQVITFKEALSDTELESLTSWDSFNEMALGQGYSIK